jgi:hypothetical protein
MSGVSRQSGTCATSAQVTVARLPSGASDRRQQAIALVIERHGGDAAERLVAEIGDAGVDLEIFQEFENFDRGARPDGEAHVRVPLAIRRRQRRHHRQRGRDRGDAQASGQSVTQRIDLLAHGAGVADDAPCPFQHALALRRKPLKA